MTVSQMIDSRVCIVLAFVTYVTAGCSDRVVPDGAPSGEQCDVLLNPVTTIGEGAGPNSPTAESRVIAAKGLYFVAPTYTPGEVSVFDSKGEYLRSIGLRGRGPGENMEARKLALVGDTLFVYDGTLRRINAFLITGEYVRTEMLLTGTTPLAAHGRGGIVTIHDASTRGPATIELRRGGQTLSTFEVSNESTAAGNKLSAKFADANGQGLWLAFIPRFQFELFTYSGKRVAQISRDIPWYWNESQLANGADLDSVAGIADIAVDPLGRLLSLTLVQRLVKQSGHAVDRPILNNKAMIHVIDPATDRMVAEHIENASQLRGFANGTLMYARGELEDGTSVIRVFRIHVVKPQTLEVCQ